MGDRWLSWGLLVLAYATFGRFLHTSETGLLVWWVTLAFVIVKAGVLTVVWVPVRKFALLGFQSDIGYSIMVLLLASLTVLVVVQFRSFAYIIVLVATAILARVDTLIARLGDRSAFLALTVMPLLGLGLSWLPQLLRRGVAIFG